MAGVQFGDIARAIELCDKLIRICFEPINDANLKYADFKQNVLQLRTRLNHLKDELERALLHSELDRQRYRQLKDEVDLIAGDFNETLEACERLLRKHIKYDENKRSSALNNLFWHTSTQAEVDRLQNRLKSHTYKIWLIIEPVQLQLVSRIDETTLEIHRILEQLRVYFGIGDAIPLPAIPHSIQRRLEEGFRRNCPVPSGAFHEISLQDGVDILCEHYRECTFQSTSSGIGATLEQKLSLLKAHWLSKILGEQLGLRQTPLDSLFVRIIKQVEQGVEKQYRIRKILEWHEDLFLGLDDSVFNLWPPKPLMKLPDPTEPDTYEKKLLDVEVVSPYPDAKQTLLILQIKEKTLRTVLSTDQEGSPRIITTPTSINLHQDGFLPRYTVANLDSRGVKKWNVEVVDGRGDGQTAYELRSRNHAQKVQMVFTGKRIWSHHESVSCTLTWKSKILRDKKLRDRQFSGRGEVQMWWEKPNAPGRDHPSTLLSGESEVRSFLSGSTNTQASRAFSQLHADVHSVYGNKNGNEMVVAEMPPPPIMVGFLKNGDDYFMWCFDCRLINCSLVL
jgi:hypothetical protein